MDYKYIEQLLSRYFEATATLKEEQILKAFFAQDDEELPEALRQYKPLFEAMEKGDVLGTDFDDRILSLVSNASERCVVGNASERYNVVGNASERCVVGNASKRYNVVGNASERCNVVGNASERCSTDDSLLIPQKARIISLQERFRPLLRAAAVVAVILTLSTAINQSFRNDNVWTDEDQIAHYQDEIRKAALAAATADSVLLYSEGISIKADSLAADTMHLAPTGYLE